MTFINTFSHATQKPSTRNPLTPYETNCWNGTCIEMHGKLLKTLSIALSARLNNSYSDTTKQLSPCVVVNVSRKKVWRAPHTHTHKNTRICFLQTHSRILCIYSLLLMKSD